MNFKKGMDKFYVGLFILVLIMVNPPVLNLINSYSAKNPIMFGYPTLWLWLQAWYAIAIIGFLVAAITLPSWKKEYEED